MNKYYVIGFFLLILLIGCKSKKLDLNNELPKEEVTSKIENNIANSISINSNCYTGERLVCIDSSLAAGTSFIKISNLENKTLHSAYITFGSCISDNIDVEKEKIATFILNNCKNIEEKRFSIQYVDDEGKNAIIEGTMI